MPSARCIVFVVLSLALTAAGAADVANYQQLRKFSGTPDDGELLFDGVIEGSDGKLYGATVNGGPDDGGTVFRMNKDGTSYQLLHSFSFSQEHGISPWGVVAEGNDGKIYGATRRGGASDAGTIFRMEKDGSSFATVRHFTTNLNDGAFPLNSVIVATDGRIYGRTLAGGLGDGSAIFGLNKDGGGYAVLHSFAVRYNDHGDSYSGLLEGSDGKLYGTTYADGAHDHGSVFRLNKDGSQFQTLHDFQWTTTDGGYPYGAVSEGSDGVLYGATSYGGAHDWGTLYRINRDGTGYVILRHFNAINEEGYLPVGAPVEGPGGRLYGTTYFGGPHETGTIYMMRKDGGDFETIRVFQDDEMDGLSPNATMLRGSDGALYGTTFIGPRGFPGTVFRIKPTALTGERGSSGYHVHLDGFVGHIYAVDRATSMPPAWTEIRKATNTTGRVSITDTNAPSGQRIYRARVVNP